MNIVGADVELARPNEVVAPVVIVKNQEIVVLPTLATRINS